MVKGISFEIPQSTTNTLWKILNVIKVSECFWYCIKNQTEVWNKDCGEDFFLQEYYDGESFSECIRFDHHIVFLKLQAHSSSDVFQNIHSYDEFVSSDCQLIILVHDCEYVEIYIKNRFALDAILERVKELGYNNINYITIDNDVRSILDVL